MKERPRNRRNFLKKALSGAVGAGTALVSQQIGERLPVYDQKLAALPARPVDARTRQLLVLQLSPTGEENAKKQSLQMGVAGPLLLGAATMLAPGKKTRRATLGLGAASLAFPWRGLGATHSEAREFNKLVDDLKSAGYSVSRTSDLEEFTRLLTKASKNRASDAKTILLMDAHGAYDPQAGAIIGGGEKKLAITVSTLAKYLSHIPGHKFVASSSCFFDPGEFEVAEVRGPISTFSLGGTLRLAWPDNPFYSTLRRGIRNHEDIIEGTRKAIEHMDSKRPLIVRAANRFKNRGTPEIQSKHELEL